MFDIKNEQLEKSQSNLPEIGQVGQSERNKVVPVPIIEEIPS